jgi:hypothetical protein
MTWHYSYKLPWLWGYTCDYLDDEDVTFCQLHLGPLHFFWHR